MVVFGESEDDKSALQLHAGQHNASNGRECFLENLE